MFFNFQIQSRCCTTVMLLVLQYLCFIGPIQSWSREADIMRLGWIAMYLLYTLSRSIWILWQCMAITARSDSLSVVILLLNHVWILLTQENDLSASVLPIGNTARIFSSSLMLGKNKLSAQVTAQCLLLAVAFPWK